MSDTQYLVKGFGKQRVVGADVIAEFCLRMCGGGYDQKQVADAMLMQSKAIETGRLTAAITIEEIK